MYLCRFKQATGDIRIGLAGRDSKLLDLTACGVTQMTPLLECENPGAQLARLAAEPLPSLSLSEVQLLAPVERQEIWASGVTYLRSKAARMEESAFSANAYDQVYSAARPEIFFKALPEKVVGPNDSVGIRRDSKWNVPEPELALVINSGGAIVGHTIGNDMSSRDLEGENLLYLPQAKIYNRSCALGPWVAVGPSEEEARQWTIKLAIQRAGTTVFAGETSVGKMKRSFDELARYLYQCQTFAHGAVLLTGTGLVPPDDFTLQEADVVAIELSGIGTLRNHVVRV